MNAPPRPHPRCFQGIIPAVISTASADGVPNVTYLSHVHAIDDRHVALSCQFFNKTKKNALENPWATITLYDPLTFEPWRLVLRYRHEETSGPLFEAMRIRIDAIASHTGMAGVFRLLSADVYEVLECEKVEGFIDPPEVMGVDDPGGPRSELRGLHLVSQRACCVEDLDELLSGVLEALEVGLGFEHAMVLLVRDDAARLEIAATRGYPGDARGTVIEVGGGLIGTVAKERRPLRISGVEAELRYGRAIRASVEKSEGRSGATTEMPLPGLPDAQSHLGLPLLVQDRLLGVLAVESRHQLGFDDWDETFLEIIANQVAVALDLILTRETRSGTRPRSEPDRATLHVHFYRNDDCVFADGEYLIRNVPGRILWKLLRAYVDDGRTEFSNRELRLDPWLGLPSGRDNLESRLVLLRKRLELRCPQLRLPSTHRGHFRIEADCELKLTESDGARTINAS